MLGPALVQLMRIKPRHIPIDRNVAQGLSEMIKDQLSIHSTSADACHLTSHCRFR